MNSISELKAVSLGILLTEAHTIEEQSKAMKALADIMDQIDDLTVALA